ncbi:MAG: hypothetical protein KGV59_03120 [Tenacibaculum sp.]|nr:hypothetical protein [Tenacibaculum sp.]
MNKKYIIILQIFALLNFNLTAAQFPGKKSKKNFLAIDNITYKVGDFISFGQPIKGKNYASIISFKRKSFLDNVTDVSNALSGKDIESTKFTLGTKDLKLKKDAKIKFFKILKGKENKEILYAIVSYTKEIDLAIPINNALELGEIKSNNPNFNPSINQKGDTDDTHIKSFSSDFDVKLLSVKGDRNSQTITIEMLIKHKIVHQKMCLNYGTNDAKLYDFEGNEYLVKEVKIGAIKKNSYNFGGYVCNKIPTNIPVKATVTFKQILPDKSKMSFFTIKVGYTPFDSYDYEYGNIEMTNLNVEWK